MLISINNPKDLRIKKESIKKLLLISLVVGTSLPSCKAITNNNNQQGGIGAVRVLFVSALQLGIKVNTLGPAGLGLESGFGAVGSYRVL